MNGFDAFFPSTSAPRNPYRHPDKNRRINGNHRLNTGFVVIGTLVCFLMFVMWKGMPSRIIKTTETTGMIEEETTFTPRLRQGREPILLPPFHMNVMTFNLRYASANDGMNSWYYRKAHVADIINRYHPIVMGTQEGLTDQLEELEVYS